VNCEPKFAGAVGQGKIRNPGRATSAVGSRYQRTGDVTADWRDSIRSIVNYRLFEIEKALVCEL
jgi:hypothetical protein